MTIVEKNGLAEKVSRIVCSARFLLARISGILVVLFLFMILSTVTYQTPQFKDMETGFTCLAVVYLGRFFLTLICSFVAAGVPRFKRRALTIDWLVSGVFCVTGGVVVLNSEAAYIGHGVRGWVWVALIGYQLVAAAASFMAAHGVLHGFERFDLLGRKRARELKCFEEAVLADLAETLKV